MNYRTLTLALATMAFAACADTPATDDEERDISLAGADSVMPLDDSPEPEEQGGAPQAPPAPRPSTPPPPSLDAGASFVVYLADTIRSDRHEAGDLVLAVLDEALTDARGRTVVPAGAQVVGTIHEITTDDGGWIHMTFDQVEFGGASFAISTVVDSLGFRTDKGGVDAGDVAKVGAGAVVGGVAGRVIGGNTRGAVIGAVAGAAAGAGIAVATKGSDLIIDAGSAIMLTLTERFTPRGD